MSGIVKCPNRSVLGLRGGWPNTGTTYKLTRAHDANLDIGLSDFGYILDMKSIGSSRLYGTTLVQKEAGIPTAGYMLHLAINQDQFYVAVQMRNAAGGAIGHAGPWITYGGRHIITVCCNRNGNAYGRSNSDEAINMGLDPLTNINQDNAGTYNLFDNDITALFPNMGIHIFSWQWYNFGVGGCPSVADITQIHNEMMANPYAIPPTMAARANHATELKMYLSFKDLDPAATVITDESAYTLSPTIVGGNTVATAVKEFMSP